MKSGYEWTGFTEFAYHAGHNSGKTRAYQIQFMQHVVQFLKGSDKTQKIYFPVGLGINHIIDELSGMGLNIAIITDPLSMIPAMKTPNYSFLSIGKTGGGKQIELCQLIIIRNQKSCSQNLAIEVAKNIKKHNSIVKIITLEMVG